MGRLPAPLLVRHDREHEGHLAQVAEAAFYRPGMLELLMPNASLITLLASTCEALKLLVDESAQSRLETCHFLTKNTFFNWCLNKLAYPGGRTDFHLLVNHIQVRPQVSQQVRTATHEQQFKLPFS